jgi:cell cycle serine/threonine-protein kinase CDC5/MSD2
MSQKAGLCVLIEFFYSTAPEPVAKINAFYAAAHVLGLAFDARAAGKLFKDPRNDSHLPLHTERVFIVS